MAATPILMPKLGLTMTEGLLAEWKVAPGEVVKAGDVIFVVETDKISNEIEAGEDGVVGELLVAEGDTVPVGTAVAIMNGASPPRHGEGDHEVVEGTRGRALFSPAGPLHHPSGGPPPRPGEDPAAARIVATPLARRMAAQAGVDLAAVIGSGPNGRIMAEDVTAAGTRKQAIAQQPTPKPVQDTIRELTPYQRVAARRLAEAKRDIPHFYVFADADVTDLLALREQLNTGPVQIKLTVNSFLVAALARTLAAFPDMNRVWAGEGLRALPTIDIGMAVEGPKGLVAPVLRDLGTLTLDETAAVADALIAKARSGKLSPRDLEGGAIAISNVGMFGATGLLPIINPGQSSILGVGAAQPVFRPDEAGRPVLRQMLHLALSCDHRVIDGALSARFLQALCRRLETPAALLRRPPQED